MQIQNSLCGRKPTQGEACWCSRKRRASAFPLSKVRLLSHPQRHAQPFFSLLLVGDENLRPNSPWIHRPPLPAFGSTFSLAQADSPHGPASRNAPSELLSRSCPATALQASSGIPRLTRITWSRCFDKPHGLLLVPHADHVSLARPRPASEVPRRTLVIMAAGAASRWCRNLRSRRSEATFATTASPTLLSRSA